MESSAIRWASLVSGKKETEAEYLVQKSITDALNRKRDEEKRASAQKSSTILSSNEPPRVIIGPGQDSMVLPKGITSQTADLAEQFVWTQHNKCTCGTCGYSWQPDTGQTSVDVCAGCGATGYFPILSATKTVGEFRTHFDAYYTKCVTERFQGKYCNAFNLWRASVGATPCLTSLTDWAAHMKATEATPWYNIMYLYISKTAFDSVLWALSISGTFRTPYQNLRQKDADDQFLSGFLKVSLKNELGDDAVLTWLVDDITAYRSYPRRTKYND